MNSRKPPGIRLSPEQRQEQITREAIAFFAEFGFEGQTRELARRLGITQPLLYRYFSSKDALLEHVYDEVFLRPWNPEWENWIGAPSGSLLERLTRFYQDYARVILRYEWIRLLMFAGPKGASITGRHARQVSERIYPLVVEQLRLSQGGPRLAAVAITEAERERMWSLHAGIVDLGVRRWVYGMDVPADQDGAVANLVAGFLRVSAIAPSR
jgi:AcrR family transcriptional regulator